MPTTADGIHYVTNDLRPPWVTSGLPVIFNHGIGTNHDIWAEWVPVIAARHPVVRFDMRGFGQSAIPPEHHKWSMDEMVKDLWDVADTTRAGKVHLVGESFGGTIALAAAVARPQRVASVTISNATFKGAGVGQLQYWKDQFAEGGTAGWSERMMVHRFVRGVGDPRALAWFAREQATTRPHVALGFGTLLGGNRPDRADENARCPDLDRDAGFQPVRSGAARRRTAPSGQGFEAARRARRPSRLAVCACARGGRRAAGVARPV
jgi:3-oxoadipate enol-lactonase